MPICDHLWPSVKPISSDERSRSGDVTVTLTKLNPIVEVFEKYFLTGLGSWELNEFWWLDLRYKIWSSGFKFLTAAKTGKYEIGFCFTWTGKIWVRTKNSHFLHDVRLPQSYTSFFTLPACILCKNAMLSIQCYLSKDRETCVWIKYFHVVALQFKFGSATVNNSR